MTDADDSRETPEPETSELEIPEAENHEVETTDRDDVDTPDDASPSSGSSDDPSADEPVDEGELLFYEPGGSWWVTAIGPVLIGAVLAMEISGPGQVHWLVLGIFAVILIGFSVVQVHAARTHVSVRLTEATLRQGTQVVPLTDIATVFPANNGPEHQDWESARALGELPAVPRRRKGVGVRLADGTVRQAWARDVDRFRTELTEARLAAHLRRDP